MANTWAVSNTGAVTLNGTLLANPFYSKVCVKWDTEHNIVESYVECEVPSTSEINAITQVLAVVPNIPTLDQLHIYKPRTKYVSHTGDTINVAGLSILQTSERPDKEGV